MVSWIGYRAHRKTPSGKYLDHQRMTFLLSGRFPNNTDEEFNAVKNRGLWDERNLRIANVALKLHLVLFVT